MAWLNVSEGIFANMKKQIKEIDFNLVIVISGSSVFEYCEKVNFNKPYYMTT